MSKSFSRETWFVLVIVAIAVVIFAGLTIKSEMNDEESVKLENKEVAELTSLEKRVTALEKAAAAAHAAAPAPAVPAAH